MIEQNKAKLISIDEVYSGVSANREHYQTQAEMLTGAPAETLALYENLREFALSLGDDVQENQRKHYTAFRRLKNFTCVTIQLQKLRVFLKLIPATVELEEGFTKDVTGTGHQGTGDLEVTIHNAATLEKAKLLIERSYMEN